jgi:hypothetical protein
MEEISSFCNRKGAMIIAKSAKGALILSKRFLILILLFCVICASFAPHLRSRRLIFELG